MSVSDPTDIREALGATVDAFNEEGHGIPPPEPDIDTNADWKTQLIKKNSTSANHSQRHPATYGIVRQFFLTPQRQLDRS